MTMAMPMAGSAAKVVTFEVSIVAVALRDITTDMFHKVSTVVLCDRRNTIAPFSEDDFHLS